MKIAYIAFAIVLILTACGGSGSSSTAGPTTSPVASSAVSPAVTPRVDPKPVANYKYLGTTSAELSITSGITGIKYPYHVYLPPNYAQSGKNYPVVYGADAPRIFPIFRKSSIVKAKM